MNNTVQKTAISRYFFPMQLFTGHSLVQLLFIYFFFSDLSKLS